MYICTTPPMQCLNDNSVQRVLANTHRQFLATKTPALLNLTRACHTQLAGGSLSLVTKRKDRIDGERCLFETRRLDRINLLDCCLFLRSLNSVAEALEVVQENSKAACLNASLEGSTGLSDESLEHVVCLEVWISAKSHKPARCANGVNSTVERSCIFGSGDFVFGVLGSPATICKLDTENLDKEHNLAGCKVSFCSISLGLNCSFKLAVFAFASDKLSYSSGTGPLQRLHERSESHNDLFDLQVDRPAQPFVHNMHLWVKLIDCLHNITRMDSLSSRLNGAGFTQGPFNCHSRHIAGDSEPSKDVRREEVHGNGALILVCGLVPSEHFAEKVQRTTQVRLQGNVRGQLRQIRQLGAATRAFLDPLPRELISRLVDEVERASSSTISPLSFIASRFDEVGLERKSGLQGVVFCIREGGLVRRRRRYGQFVAEKVAKALMGAGDHILGSRWQGKEVEAAGVLVINSNHGEEGRVKSDSASGICVPSFLLEVTSNAFDASIDVCDSNIKSKPESFVVRVRGKSINSEDGA
ncbi:hypothetical protein KCU61_g141, partial [Aureobasidium melanogenum]